MSETEVVYETRALRPATQSQADPADLVPTLVYSPAEMKRRLDELQEFVKEVMKVEVDYGPAFPGSKKLVLYKAGGEKLAEIYGYSVRPVCVRRIEIWKAGANTDPTLPPGPFFHYEFEAEVYSKRTGNLVGKGFGSCNSKENRYRWRQGARACPTCGNEGAIIKGRQEYGGGWLCFAKKGGCGAKFTGEDAKLIESQEAGRVENDDIETQVNTILKMAKKRAYLDAVIAVTQSAGIFTVEDDDGGDESAEAAGGGKEPRKTSNGSARKSFQWRGETIETAGVNATQLLKIEKIMKDFNAAHGAEATLVALKALTGAETMFDLTEDLANVVINQGLPAPADTEKGAGTGGGAAATTGTQQELGQTPAKGKENPYA